MVMFSEFRKVFENRSNKGWNMVHFHHNYKMVHNKDNNTCFNKARLTTLVRDIFREEFERQQKNLLNLVSGNIKITL